MAELTVTRAKAPRDQLRIQAHREALELGFMLVMPVHDEGLSALPDQVRATCRLREEP